MSRASTRLLDERAGMLLHHLSGALRGDDEAIHEMRVAGRRLRVILLLLARKPRGRRVRRVRRILKRLIRAAATSRDLDVCLSLFDEHVRAHGLVSGHVRELRRRFHAGRRRDRSRMVDAMQDQDLPALRRDLGTIVARGGERRSAVMTRTREARDAMGESLLAGGHTLGERFDPDELHDLRRRIRRLRYLAEVVTELGGENSPRPRQLRRLQDRLGRIHDAHVLASRLARQAIAADGHGGFGRTTRRLQAAFQALSRAHHRAYLDEGPADVLKRVLAGMVPAGPATRREPR